jgi:long-chain acyl-CoA synthetase
MFDMGTEDLVTYELRHFTGGTTGLPKVVEHTHGRVVAAVRSAEYVWPTRIGGNNAVLGVRPGSVGKPIPGSEVQVVDLDTGLRVLPPGQSGELRVRGPRMMTGYRNRPEETAQTIRDGFVYTGDIGYLDEDGFLFITDRKEDVVFVKGFNVFPREVEEVIHTHPKVDMVGVVGVPDARTGGKRLLAFVAPRAGETLDAAEISVHCASRLAGYKCPTEVRVVGQLPLTAAKKLDRAALRRETPSATAPMNSTTR